MTLSAPKRQSTHGDSHYQVLGVPLGANQEQIKAAYRRRALRLHPDKRPDDDEADELFKRCSEAYAVLSDSEQRVQYDTERLLAAGPAELAAGLVSDLLGGRFRRKKRGGNLQYTLELDLEECARGIERTIEFIVDEHCGACGGSGAANGGQRSCGDCGGKGLLRKNSLISLPQPCPGCGGSGHRIERSCGACNGVGMVERRRKYRLSFPPGVRNGEVKVVTGHGEPGTNGGGSGDLHVRVRVRPHTLFERRGKDLHLVLPISLPLAALGGSVVVPVPGGEVRMRIPAGVQSGRTFRVRGKGVGGDLLVEVAVETPLSLDEELRQLLERLEAHCGNAQYPRQQAYLEQVAALKGRRTPQ